jgi:hypothetical protein
MSGSAFALLVSTIMLGLLIKSLIHKFDVGILLYANIYIGIFSFSLFSLMNNVDMYKGDYGLFVGEETLSCRIRGYMLYVFGCYARYVLALQVSYLRFSLTNKKEKNCFYFIKNFRVCFVFAVSYIHQRFGCRNL